MPSNALYRPIMVFLLWRHNKVPASACRTTITSVAHFYILILNPNNLWHERTQKPDFTIKRAHRILYVLCGKKASFVRSPTLASARNRNRTAPLTRSREIPSVRSSSARPRRPARVRVAGCETSFQCLTAHFGNDAFAHVMRHRRSGKRGAFRVGAAAPLGAHRGSQGCQIGPIDLI